MSAGATLRRPLSAEDFRRLVGKRVLVAGGFTVIGAAGDTIVEGVEDDSHVDSVTLFPASQ